MLNRSYASVRLYSAALLTLGSAFIHLSVAPEHLREYAPFGVFLLALGSAQIILAVELLARPTRRLALALTITTIGTLALWTVSRTIGLPIGPTPGTPEDMGLPDVVCALIEVLALIPLAALSVWPPRRQPRRVWLVGLGTSPTALVTTLLSAVAVLATLNAMPEAATAAPSLPGQPTTSITTLVETPGDQPLTQFTLTAAPLELDGQTLWALNGGVPGPELRVTVGDRVRVTLINHLPESTSLHWHGVVLPNAEDGVAGVTQDAVAPGAAYTYEFVATEPGTYWYHSHQQTEAQLPRGLFGALVVLPRDDPHPQQHDDTLVYHGSSGQVFVNGQRDSLHLDAAPGETVRLRIINTVVPGMDGGPEVPLLVGAPFKVLALDGRDLHATDSLGATRIPLGMGQRADLVFTMPDSGAVQLVDSELVGEVSSVQRLFQHGVQPQFPTVTIGDGAAPSTADVNSVPVFDALRYGAPAPDPVASATADQTLPVVLAEHPGFRDGVPQLVHTINGQASPSVPPIMVAEGQIVRLHIVNDTAEYHPMHLHGHVMSMLSVDGAAVEGSPVRLDSVLVGPHQTIDVAFAANNPGVWMLHCHVLLHAGMGMTTSVNYEGYSTPFEMGTRSGNMPE